MTGGTRGVCGGGTCGHGSASARWMAVRGIGTGSTGSGVSRRSWVGSEFGISGILGVMAIAGGIDTWINLVAQARVVGAGV